MIRFYKIIKLIIAVITTINAIALKPTSPTHTTKGQCRNSATACHPRWKTAQKENATNCIIKCCVELLTSNTILKRPTKKQTTKTAMMEISHNNPINERHKKKKEKQQKRKIPQPNFATLKQKNSLEWHHALLKTPNLVINAALKDLHNPTNETPHNKHAGFTTQ